MKQSTRLAFWQQAKVAKAKRLERIAMKRATKEQMRGYREPVAGERVGLHGVVL